MWYHLTCLGTILTSKCTLGVLTCFGTIKLDDKLVEPAQNGDLMFTLDADHWLRFSDYSHTKSMHCTNNNNVQQWFI